MSAEIWNVLPHERTAFARRRKLLLGVPVKFGDVLLTLLRDRVDGELGPVRMAWQLVNSDEVRETALSAVDLAAHGRWLPVAVSTDGTVLFNVLAPVGADAVAA